jgi:serine/threonine-protein kinase
MDQLADSLAVTLLRELGRTRDIAAVRRASLKAASLPALKAFLEGEQLYRRGSWDSAQIAYHRALALDSTLVPALRHLGLSLSWRAIGNADFVPYLLRAGQLNRGLPRRDSLLVAVDSMMGALSDTTTLPAAISRELGRRIFATLEGSTRLYPEDPEVWYQLGEARMHFGVRISATRKETLEPFDRAIALDSSFGPAYPHATQLGLTLYGLPGWNRYARPYLALGPLDRYADNIRFLDVVLNDSTARNSSKTDSLFRDKGPDVIVDAMVAAWEYPDSAETAVRLGRTLMRAPGHSQGIAGDPLVQRLLLAGVLGYRGHVDQSLEVLGEEERISWVASWPTELAMVAPNKAPGIDTRLKRWLHRGPLWPPGSWPTGGPPGPLLFALPWWAERGDTASIATFARRVDSAQRVSTTTLSKEVESYSVQSAAAYFALASGDTATALTRFAALPRDVEWGALDRATEGRVLARQGRDEEALRLLERAFPVYWSGPVYVLTTLESGALAEKLGRREQALQSYQFVSEVWRNADPELQQYVTQAREGLARLTSEPQ